MLIPNELMFQTEDEKYGMKICKKFINHILNHCQNASPNETGGIMVGYYSDDLRWAIITDITGPPNDSILKRFFLYRGTNGLQKLLNSKWKYKKHYYLGEWHFHPFSLPIPSQIDNMQMRSFANDRFLHCPEPILMILGGYPAGEWEITSYIFIKKIRKELKILDEIHGSKGKGG